MILPMFFLIICFYKLSDGNCAANFVVVLEKDEPLSSEVRNSKTHQGDKLRKHGNKRIRILEYDSQRDEPTNKLFDTSILNSVLEDLRSELTIPPWPNEILEDNINVHPLWLHKKPKRFNAPHKHYVRNLNFRQPKKKSKVKSHHKIKNSLPVIEKRSKSGSSSRKNCEEANSKSFGELKNKFRENSFELPSKTDRNEHVSPSKSAMKHGNSIVPEKLAVKNESEPISFPKNKLSNIPPKSGEGQQKPTLNTISKIISSENPVQENEIKLKSGQFIDPTHDYVQHLPKINHTIQVKPKKTETPAKSSLMENKDPITDVNVEQTQTSINLSTDNLVTPQTNSSLKDNKMPTSATSEYVEYPHRKQFGGLLSNFKVTVEPKPVDISIVTSTLKSDATPTPPKYRFIGNDNTKPDFHLPFSVLPQQEEKIINTPTVNDEQKLNTMSATSIYTFVTDNKIEQVHNTTSDFEEEMNPILVPILNSTRNISMVKSAIENTTISASQADTFDENYNRKQLESLSLVFTAQMDQIPIDTSKAKPTIINNDVMSTTPTYTFVEVHNGTQLFDNLPSSGSVQLEGKHEDSYGPNDKVLSTTSSFKLKTDYTIKDHSILPHDITLFDFPFSFLEEKIIRKPTISHEKKLNTVFATSAYTFVTDNNIQQVDTVASDFEEERNPVLIPIVDSTRSITTFKSAIESTIVPASQTDTSEGNYNQKQFENDTFDGNYNRKQFESLPLVFNTQMDQIPIGTSIALPTINTDVIFEDVPLVFTAQTEQRPIGISVVNPTINNDVMFTIPVYTIVAVYNSTQLFDNLPSSGSAQGEGTHLDSFYGYNDNVISTTTAYKLETDYNIKDYSSLPHDIAQKRTLFNLSFSDLVDKEVNIIKNPTDMSATSADTFVADNKIPRTHTITSDFEEEGNPAFIPIANSTRNVSTVKSAIENNIVFVSQTDTFDGNYNRKQFESLPLVFTTQINQIPIGTSIANPTINTDVISTTPTYSFAEDHDSTQLSETLPSSSSLQRDGTQVGSFYGPTDNVISTTSSYKLETDYNIKDYSILPHDIAQKRTLFNLPFSVLVDKEEKLIKKPTVIYEKKFNKISATSATSFVTDNNIQEVDTVTSDLEEERNPVHIPIVNLTRNISIVKSAIENNIVLASQTDTFEGNYNRKQFESLPLVLTAHTQQRPVGISIVNPTINNDVMFTLPFYTTVEVYNSTQLFDKLPSSDSVQRDRTHVYPFYGSNDNVIATTSSYKLETDNNLKDYSSLPYDIEQKRTLFNFPFSFLADKEEKIIKKPTVSYENKFNEMSATSAYTFVTDNNFQPVDTLTYDLKEERNPVHIPIDNSTENISTVKSAVKNTIVPASQTDAFEGSYNRKQFKSQPLVFTTQMYPLPIDTSITNPIINNDVMSTTPTYTFVEVHNSTELFDNLPSSGSVQGDGKRMDSFYGLNDNVISTTSSYKLETDYNIKDYSSSLHDIAQKQTLFNLPFSFLADKEENIIKKPIVSDVSDEKKFNEISAISAYTFVTNNMFQPVDTVTSNFKEELNPVHIPIDNLTKNNISTVKSAIKNNLKPASQTDTFEGNYNRKQFESLPLIFTAQTEEIPIRISVDNPKINRDVMSTIPPYTFVEDRNSTELLDNLPSSGSAKQDGKHKDSFYKQNDNIISTTSIYKLETDNTKSFRNRFNAVEEKTKPMDTPRVNDFRDDSSAYNIVDHNSKHARSLPYEFVAKRKRNMAPFSLKYSSVNDHNNKQIYRLPYNLAREGKQRAADIPPFNLRKTHIHYTYGSGIKHKHKPSVSLISRVKHEMESINNFFGLPLEKSVIDSYTGVLITNPKNPNMEKESYYGYNPIIQYIPYYCQQFSLQRNNKDLIMMVPNSNMLLLRSSNLRQY
ncbi:uncharacterized protein LOC126882032 [Diabrotica virgifera virgifera]|uniref:Uncharacterized protein n=1 Tax=Diabrotica virgifera virgifera TaxID=50390 RepID=A0ABM5JXU7_DIAVI|nr:uncharacterized protein LOC126882032 [Diabrotica virgifera virgifera]